MNAADEKELGKYLRWVANEMGLRDWMIELRVTNEHPKGGYEPKDDDAEYTSEASASPTPGAKFAIIAIREDFRDVLDKNEQRYIVVHELVHLHVADMREFPRSGLLIHLAQATYDAFMFGFDQAWEHAVDGIARPWAEKMPYIKWPAKKKRRK